MGKKGAALRAAKAQTATYTFTREQLEEHDRVVKQEYAKYIKDEVKRRADAIDNEREQRISDYIEDEWKKREELFKNNHDGLINILSLLGCTASRVLIEKFHWKPIPSDGGYDRRLKIVQFMDALVQEINMICEDETADIRRYCDETYGLYGVRFMAEDE